MIAGINPNTVVIGHDVPEYNAFDLIHWHLFRLNFVELFFFQRGEEAFQPSASLSISLAFRSAIGRKALWKSWFVGRRAHFQLGCFRMAEEQNYRC